MHRVAAKFVPRLLTPEQKEHHIAICQELRQRAVDDPSFMSRVITGDESWVYGYDPETKQQSLQGKSPGSPRMKKARQSRSTTKSMPIMFFEIRGIVHHEFFPESQTVNAEFYCNVLRRLRGDIRRKQPEMWCAGNWLLHDDNVPSHRSLVTREFLAHKGIITLPHPPYSSDLAPSDFFLLPKMKLQLKGRRFDRVEEIQRESQNVLGTLREQDFQHMFQQWQWCWDQCVTAQGDYFEGDAAQT
jgi:histone-lysine N-methyltransferase SETMAR